MTHTNTPKPARRPAGGPTAEAAPDRTGRPVGPSEAESPGVCSTADEAPVTVPAPDAEPAAASGEISVVTVSDAQDRTSAGSLSAVSAGAFEPQDGWQPVGMPAADRPAAEEEQRVHGMTDGAHEELAQQLLQGANARAEPAPR